MGVRDSNRAMRRALRILGVVGVWAGVSFVGPAADANHTIVLTPCTASPTSPPTPTPGPSASPSPEPTSAPTPQNCVPESGSRLTGTINIQFEVRATSSRPISSVKAYIDAQEEDVPAPRHGNPFLQASYSRSQQVGTRTYQFAWNTLTDTPYNGSYKLRVEASAFTSSLGGPETHKQEASRRDLLVDNPPAGLAAPRIVAKTSTTVSVEWDRAVEPDVVSYRLYRAMTDAADEMPSYGSFTEVGSVPTTSLTDQVEEDGFYWYTVIVTRRSVVTPESGISSVPSPISSAAEVKTVQPDDDDGGSGGGGGTKATPIPFRPRVVSRLPSLTLPRSAARGAPAVPDAPFSAVLPYDIPEGGEELPEQGEPGGDPRGPVLPVAVGAFLVSSALALGRMPY